MNMITSDHLGFNHNVTRFESYVYLFKPWDEMTCSSQKYNKKKV